MAADEAGNPHIVALVGHLTRSGRRPSVFPMRAAVVPGVGRPLAIQDLLTIDLLARRRIDPSPMPR